MSPRVILSPPALAKALEEESRPLADVRVALFTGAYNHIADGVSLTLNRLVRHLELRGAHVVVFAPTVDLPALEHAGTLEPVPSVAMPGRPEYRVSLGLSRSQERRFSSFQPHLVHIATPDLPGGRALRLAEKHGIPAVASYHTHFSSYLSYYKLGWAEGFLWRHLRKFHSRCIHTYVPSASMRDVLAGHGITAGVRLWHRGVDLELFHPGRRDLPWRRSLGFTDDDVVVTFVSRLVMEKGLDVFADTVRLLDRKGILVRCLIVGEGPAREFLRERVPEAVFLGHQSGTDLARAYASSDVFLFPSYTETFGNVTLEAMASGLPAICADATGSSSLVVPEVTGFLAPPEDAHAFAAHIQTVALNPTVRGDMGTAARQAAETYAWPVVLDQMVSHYREVLDLTPLTV